MASQSARKVAKLTGWLLQRTGCQVLRKENSWRDRGGRSGKRHQGQDLRAEVEAFPQRISGQSKMGD